MILLDTSVVLWTLRDDPRLGKQARSRIARDPIVHVSTASLVELTIKSMLDKIEMPLNLSALLEEEGMTELRIGHSHADAIRRFPELMKHDPFDRILVAQAEAENLNLLTSDRKLLSLGRDFIVDARI